MPIQIIIPFELATKSGWKNPADMSSLIAWQPNLGVLIQRITHCDDSGCPLYDQPLICEGIGAVTVAIDKEGRIGLQKQWRPCISPEYLEEYMQLMGDNKKNPSKPSEIPGFMFGRTSWELPRGLFDFTKDATPEDTARRETEEETNLFVSHTIRIGTIVPNTTFFAQPTDVFKVEFNFSQKPDSLPDLTERFLSRLRWFDLEEVRNLQASQDFFCGYSLASIQLAAMNNPEWAVLFYRGSSS